MTPAPAWIKDVHRIKATGREPDPISERECAYLELRLRYVKMVGDNIQLRNLLAKAEKTRKGRRRTRGPYREYEQENECTPGRVDDDVVEDLCAITDRLRGQEREW